MPTSSALPFAALLVALSWHSVVSAQTPPRVTLELSDASVATLVPELSSQLHEPVVVDADAQPAARCAHLTVSTGGAQPAARVIALVTDALRPAGLSVSRDANGVRIRHVAGAALPAGCSDSAAASTAPDADAAHVLDGIHTRPDGTVTITSAARDVILADPTLLLRTARAVPQVEHGVVVGIRLFGIRPQSFMGRLGFQNGDTVLRVNGFSVATPENALDAYSRVRSADHIDTEILRAGAPRTIHVVIEPATSQRAH